MSIGFQVASTDGLARSGKVVTPHGEFPTPAFMPVGTLGTVKGVTPLHLSATGSKIILANAYHLFLRPGTDVVALHGGIHKFMGWNGPILTDSGGYQVFSLSAITKVSDDGVTFRSHIDGKEVFLSPESATRIQMELGADIIMAFDECPSPLAERSVIQKAVERSIAWAERCKKVHESEHQALFGIVQGGADRELRAHCAKELVRIGFDGYGIGGLGIGEGTGNMLTAIEASVPHLPENRPRYLMGLGRPSDIVSAVGLGVDMFDCVIPTRNARNAMLFTDDGPIRMKNASHRDDLSPVMADCACYTCRNFSRSYLRHLYMSGEMLAGVLGSIHNITYYQSLMERCRAAIDSGNFESFARTFLNKYNSAFSD
ncbi:MAG: tRNA guanosine(34) transglycosylase Tgt [Planctomycetota bacterium]